MRMRRKSKGIQIFVIALVVISFSFVGCASLSDWFNTVKGELVGQHFEITSYDNFGNKTLTVTGSKVHVGLLENNANYNVEATGFKSEVLDITINGYQMLPVGNTIIFAEEGLDMITDYEVPNEIKVSSGGGFIPFDRMVNDIKNDIGKSKVIIIASQLGVPIGVYQGDSVYVTIPSDLPKMTRLNIDGKSLYIHRANYNIIDTALLK